MKNKEYSDSAARERVLKALATSSLEKLSPEEILLALREDGVDSLESLVTRVTDTLKDLAKLSAGSPSAINLQLLAKETPKEMVSRTVHKIPKVPFILNGTQYDPKDITRFNGRELYFVVGSQVASQGAMMAFEDKTILTNWLQMVYLSQYASADPSLPSLFRPTESASVRDYGCTPGQYCYVVFQPPIVGLPKNIWMYEDTDHRGLVLGLTAGLQMSDLSRITRRHFLNWYSEDWNDAVSSVVNLSCLCAFFENPNFQGTIRIVIPGLSINDLDYIGFNDCISSVINFG